jgi:uncharacterized protein (DUF58 family)
MPDSFRQADSRSFSLPGLLALLAGCGQIFATWKFRSYTSGWDDGLRIGNYAVAFCLTLWGLKQIVAEWQSSPARTHGSRAGRRKQYRVNIPVEGIVFLVIMSVMFIGAMLGKQNMLLLVFSLMAGAFIANGFISFNLLRHLSVKRQLPSLITAGDPANFYIEVSNQKMMTVWVLTVTDSIVNENESLRASVVFTRVPGYGKKLGQYRVQLMQRGKYQIGPVVFSTRFPLGIVERSALVHITEEVIVCPRPGTLLVSRQSLRSQDQLVMRNTTRVGAYDDEFHRIREYRYSDNPKAIHWRSSARRNELMVKEFHESRDENLMILLDLWQPRYPDTEHLEYVETAISFATTIIKDHLAAVRDSEIQIAGSGVEFSEWSGAAGMSGWESVLEYLALIQAGPTTELGDLHQYWKSRRKADTRCLLITTRSLPELSEIFGDSSADSENTQLSFEMDLLIYSATKGGLDGLFEPPENLITYEGISSDPRQRVASVDGSERTERNS